MLSTVILLCLGVMGLMGLCGLGILGFNGLLNLPDARRAAAQRRELDALLADYYASPQYASDQAWHQRHGHGISADTGVQP